MSPIVNNNSNVIVYHSITNVINDQKYDNVQPFSFIEFLQYTPSLYGSALQFSDYQTYLKKWNTVTTTSQVSYNDTVRQEFIAFLKTVTINYTTAEEKRYISNIDFNNNNDLEIAVPFFVEKIKQVCLYFAEKRENYKIDLQLAKGKGSISGISNYLKTYIIETLFGNDSQIQITSTQPLSTVSQELSIELEEGYDIFNNYYDLDPFEPPEFYNATGDRAKFFQSNTNIDDPNLFLNFDQAIINLINSERPVLQQLQSLVVSVDTPDINLLQPHDFIDYTNIARTNLRLLLNAELIQKFTGTNFYFLTTTSIGPVSGLLFEAQSPFYNLLNVYNPTTLTIPQSSLYYERDVGLFFKPTNQSILQLQTPFSFLPKADIDPNLTYIFPDPNSYGNIVGLTQTDHNTPFEFVQHGDLIQRNISSNNALGNSYVTSNDFTFESYHSKEQNSTKSFLESLYNVGIATTYLSDIYGNVYVGLKQQNTGYNSLTPQTVGNNVAMFGLSSTNIVPYSANILQVLNNGTFTNTTTVDTIPSNFTPTNNIYITRNSPGNFIVYNIVNNTVNTFVSQFATIISKYNANIQNEIQNYLYNVEIYDNTYVLTTSSYLIIDDFDYDTTTGTFNQTSHIPFIYNSVINDKASNVYLNGDILYVATITGSNDPNVVASNNRPFIINFYGYNIKNNIWSKLKWGAPLEQTLNLQLGVYLYATNVTLVYNKLQDMFDVVTTYKDLNQNIFLNNTFVYISNNLTNIVNAKTFYCTNTNFTINFFDGSNVGGLVTQALSSTPTIVQSNATITF